MGVKRAIMAAVPTVAGLIVAVAAAGGMVAPATANATPAVHYIFVGYRGPFADPATCGNAATQAADSPDNRAGACFYDATNPNHPLDTTPDAGYWFGFWDSLD